MHSLTTASATITRAPVLVRLFQTGVAATTRPMVLMRSLATLPAAETWPKVLMRSRIIPRAAVISRWAREPVKISPSAITILIQAIEELLQRPTPYASGGLELRRVLLLPELAGQWCLRE